MPVLFTNNASAPLASSIGTATTSITVTTGQGALFPVVAAGSFFYATLTDSSNNLEIIRVTARSGDTMTVVRAQEGTTARAYAAADKLELRVTAAGLNNMVQLDGTQTISGNKTFTGLQTFTQTIVGSINGNAATVTNGVYTTGDQTIAGVKTFSSTIVGNLQGNVTGNLTGNATTASSCSGNAATVTNGVYTVGDQTIAGNKTFTGAVTISNNVLVGTATSSYLGMRDDESPNGLKYLHANSNLIGFLGGGGGWIANVDESGNFTATGNVTAYSDERLKHNWRDLDVHFLSDLASVKVGIYERKDTGETQVGVGAQSLYGVLPQAIRENADGFLSVAYGNAALAACVMLAREVEAIKLKLGV